MNACPYDALYINPETQTAHKCNFCSSRIEVGLEPSCVIVCPTQSIFAAMAGFIKSHVHWEEPIHQSLVQAAKRYQARAQAEPGNEATWRVWQERALAMQFFVDQIAKQNRLCAANRVASETITVTSADPAQLADTIDQLVDQLRQRGFGVDRNYRETFG